MLFPTNNIFGYLYIYKCLLFSYEINLMLNDLKRTCCVFFMPDLKTKCILLDSSSLITKTNYLNIFLLPYSQVLSFHVILSTTIRKKGT